MLTNHRRLLFALAAAAAIAVVGNAQSSQPDAKAELDRLLSRWTRSTPGCAVGADVKGAPVLRAAYGMADLEHDTPITVDTIFEAGSVSKQFTATAVLLLARDGKLSLDDPVRKYIPELHSSTDAVTIRQMLHHTSGLRDWGNLVAVAGWPRGTRIHTQAHVLDVLGMQRALNFPPGTQWSYSNSNYNLAAILVSRVSGMSFADFTRTRIFEPLGMTDTSWRDDFSRIVKRRAIGYSEQQGRFSISMPFENVYGNAGLLTTINDLLKWNANFSRPIVGDATLIDELQRRAVLNDGRSHEYALGLYVDTYRGVREVDHSGGTAGYRAHLGRYPDQQVSVAVLCNVTGADPTNYAKTVAALFLTGLQTPTSPSPSHALTRAEAQRLVGLYRSRLPVGASNVVYTDQGGLSVQGLGRLIATSATGFLMDGGYRFDFSGSGQMRVTDEFGTVVVYERTDPARPSADQLKDYAGRYFSDEVETALDLVVEGNSLVVRRRPDFTERLTPVFADGFTSGALGWVVFRRDPAGRVAEFSISQDRLWALAFTRQP